MCKKFFLLIIFFLIISNFFYQTDDARILYPVPGAIYILREKDSDECTRVKFIRIFSHNKGVIQDIDEGICDVVEFQSLLLIKNEFLILKPLAIRAKLMSKLKLIQIEQIKFYKYN